MTHSKAKSKSISKTRCQTVKTQIQLMKNYMKPMYDTSSGIMITLSLSAVINL